MDVNNDDKDPLSRDCDLDDEGINCPDCTKVIEETDDALQCELYDYWYHIGCQNITKATYRYTRAVKIVKAVTKISRRQDALEQKLANHTDKISRHDSQIDQIEKTLETHCKQIQDFQKNNTDVPANQAGIAVRADGDASRGIVTEVTRNINEDLKGKNSNNNLKDDTVRQDMVYVQELCRHLAGEDLHHSIKQLGRRVRKSRKESEQISEQSEQSGQSGQGQEGGGGQNHEKIVQIRR